MRKFGKMFAIFLSSSLLLGVSHSMASMTKEVTQDAFMQNERTITGTITDNTGFGLPGVSVMVKGTTLGVTTDIDGTYHLDVPEDAQTLTFSFVGMKTEDVAIGSRVIIDLVMQEDAMMLDEVVAIGYGSSKKSDISTSISTVSGVEAINSRSIKSASDFLQGNVPGVTVMQQGGDPTSTPKVVIRGIGSVNTENPLWVVDGMPYDNPSFINPNDIESMSILKDAAAAAIYGAQASSGVIVITTKNGQSGKPKVTFDFMTGVAKASNLPTPLNAEEQSRAYNIATDNSGVVRLPAHDAAQNPWGQTTRTNWVDAIFRSAKMLSTNFSVGGGSEKGQYIASFSYQDREGVLIGTSSKRYTFRVKSSYDITDQITVGENFSLSYNKSIGTNTSSSYSGTILNAIYMPSAAPIYEKDGHTFHGVAPIGSAFAGAYGDVYNPVALLLRPTTNAPQTNFNGNAYITYKPIEGLTLKSSLSVDLLNTKYKKFTPQIPESGRRTEMNYLSQNWGDRKKWIWDNQVSYQKSFGEHNFDLTAVYSAQKTEYEEDYVYAQNFAKENDWYQYLMNAGEIKDWEEFASVWDDALTSAIGRVQYNYASRYFFSASVRQDKTSRLDKDNNTDIFPAFSAAWNLASESFLQDTNWLNTLKLRASWGEIGNIASVGYYSYNVPMSTQRPYLGRSPKYYPGYYVKQQSNKNLKWEVSETLDLGIDASFLGNRLEIIADYFTKKTKGMILENKPDTHTGVDKGAFMNVGDVINRGFEFSANYRNYDNEFKYSVGGNFSIIKNELDNLDSYTGQYISHRDNVRSSLYPYRSIPGQPIFSYFLIPAEGIFKSQEEINAYQLNGKLIQPNAKPGDLKFTDVNGDGKINDDDKVFQGNAFPDFTYSFNFNGKYKGFDLTLNFQGVSGADVFNGYKYSTYNMGEQSYNRDNRVLGAWSEENPNSNIPRLQVKDPNGNFGTNSTWYLEDASYLRLKNLTFGYTLPTSIVNKFAKGGTLRVYFSAENLFTITDYSGMDPEVGGIGLDVGRYPVSRTLTGGLSFTF